MLPVLKRLGLFVLFSAALLAAFSVGPLRALAGGAVACTASTILQWCWGAPVGWSLTAANDMAISVPARDVWESGTVELGTALFVRNMPLFIAIVLAVAPRLRRHVAVLLGAGLIALVLLDGVVVAYTTWRTVAGNVRPTGLVFELLALPSVYSSTGGLFVAPVFLGAFAMMLPNAERRGGEKARTTRRQATSNPSV